MRLLWLHDSIETERCILKIPEESEAEDMLNLVNNKITEFMPWDKCSSIESQKEHIIKRRYDAIRWTTWNAALYQKNGSMIGRFWLPRLNISSKRWEIWYWLWSEYWWKWYIPEAVEWLKKHVFENLNWESLIIRVNTKNTNSCRVAEKCSFQKEWILRKEEFSKGEFEDIVYYSFTREDYFAK